MTGKINFPDKLRACPESAYLQGKKKQVGRGGLLKQQNGEARERAPPQVLVELNDPDENILDEIIAYLRGGEKPPVRGSKASNIAPSSVSPAYVSEEGETVAREIRQEQNRQIDDDAAEIVRGYQNGMSTNQLARQYGCHRHTISRLLKKHGVEVSQSKIKSEEAVRQVIALYEQNHIIEEIAEQFGVSQSCINRLLHAHRVQVRDRWDYER